MNVYPGLEISKAPDGSDILELFTDLLSIVVTICYLFVYASIAELVSTIPLSGGVCHQASVTAGPRYEKAVGFFAGW